MQFSNVPCQPNDVISKISAAELAVEPKFAGH